MLSPCKFYKYILRGQRCIIEQIASGFMI